MEGGYISKPYNIIENGYYNWLTTDIVDKLLKNFHNKLSHRCVNNIKYEYELKILGHISRDNYTNNIRGIADAIDDDFIWEFKCVDKLKIEHKTQLLIYMWLWQKNSMIRKRGFLFNIRTGELLEIINTPDEIDEIMDAIILYKSTNKSQSSLEEFIINNHSHSMVTL